MRRNVHYIMSKFTVIAIVPKLKLLIAFAQCVNSLPTVYGLVLPDQYYKYLDWMNFVQLSFIEIGDLTCFTAESGYNGQLLTKGLSPLLGAGVVALVVIVAKFLAPTCSAGFASTKIVEAQEVPPSDQEEVASDRESYSLLKASQTLKLGVLSALPPVTKAHATIHPRPRRHATARALMSKMAAVRCVLLRCSSSASASARPRVHSCTRRGAATSTLRTAWRARTVPS